MQVPGRIEGSVRLQGTVQLANGLNWTTAARTRYFGDLNAMRSANNEVQTVTVSNATGGLFQLTFNGDDLESGVQCLGLYRAIGPSRAFPRLAAETSTSQATVGGLGL